MHANSLTPASSHLECLFAVNVFLLLPGSHQSLHVACHDVTHLSLRREVGVAGILQVTAQEVCEGCFGQCGVAVDDDDEDGDDDDDDGDDDDDDDDDDSDDGDNDDNELILKGDEKIGLIKIKILDCLPTTFNH